MIIIKLCLNLVVFLILYSMYLEDIKKMKNDALYGKEKDTPEYYHSGNLILKVDKDNKVYEEKESIELTLDFLDENIEKSSINYKYTMLALLMLAIIWAIIDLDHIFNLFKGTALWT